MEDEEVYVQVAVDDVEMQGSVGIGWGEDLETGDRIMFVGDWRMMLALHDALMDGEDPEAAVPSWAIQSRRPANG
jgi:hypothetical protein